MKSLKHYFFKIRRKWWKATGQTDKLMCDWIPPCYLEYTLEQFHAQSFYNSPFRSLVYGNFDNPGDTIKIPLKK